MRENIFLVSIEHVPSLVLEVGNFLVEQELLAFWGQGWESTGILKLFHKEFISRHSQQKLLV